MKEYVIFWLSGTKTKCEGTSEADAFRRAGYGGGALAAVDFIALSDDENDYEFDKETHSWRNIKINPR